MKKHKLISLRVESAKYKKFKNSINGVPVSVWFRKEIEKYLEKLEKKNG